MFICLLTAAETDLVEAHLCASICRLPWMWETGRGSW